MSKNNKQITFNEWKRQVRSGFVNGPYCSAAASSIAKMIFENPQLDFEKFFRKNKDPKVFSLYLATIVEGIDQASKTPDHHFLEESYEKINGFLNKNPLPSIALSLIAINMKKYISPLDPYYFKNAEKKDSSFFQKNEKKLQIISSRFVRQNHKTHINAEEFVDKVEALLNTSEKIKSVLKEELRNAKRTKKLDYNTEVVKIITSITQSFYGSNTLALVNEILQWHRIFTTRLDIDGKTSIKLAPSLRTLQRKNSQKRQK